MANTYSDYTATSGQTDFAFTFPYLKDTHVIVSIDGTETDVNDTGAGSFTIVTSPSTLVRLDSGATAGANVRVKRNSLGKSNTEPALVDYNDGSVLTEKDLDDAYLHNFYLSQEAVEGAAGGMSLESSNTSWDAQNKKIINVNDPTNTKDAANKTYVDTQINNTVTGSTTEAQKWTFTGDNTATEFTFSPAITLDADTAYTVAIDGVLQEPTTAYTIDADNDTITFTSAPPTSSNIVVIARGYSVPVTEGAGTVTSVTAGNGLSGGTITTSGTVSIPTSGGDLNINSGKVGIGGDADGTYKAKVTGDLLVSESSDHTVLTVENTNTSGANDSTILVTAPQNATIQLKDTDTTSANTGIYNITSANGFFNVGHISDDGLTGTPLLSLYPTGNVKIDQLPTSDPSTAGYLWNNGGVVSVSGSSGNVGIGGAANSSYLLAVNGDAVILGTGGSDTELLIKDTEAGHSARMVLETGSSGAETDIILKNLANGAVRDVNGVSTNVPRFLIRNDGSEEKTKFMTQDNTGSQDSTLSSMEILHSNGNIVLPNLPTSASGLATGTVYNDSGTLKIVT